MYNHACDHSLDIFFGSTVCHFFRNLNSRDISVSIKANKFRLHDLVSIRRTSVEHGCAIARESWPAAPQAPGAAPAGAQPAPRPVATASGSGALEPAVPRRPCVSPADPGSPSLQRLQGSMRSLHRSPSKRMRYRSKQAAREACAGCRGELRPPGDGGEEGRPQAEVLVGSPPGLAAHLGHGIGPPLLRGHVEQHSTQCGSGAKTCRHHLMAAQ